MTGPVRRVRRRDRHGRGPRGDLVPPRAPLAGRQVDVPAWRSRADAFEDLVLDALRPLLARWSDELPSVEVVVEDVPPVRPESADVGEGAVPLARTAGRDAGAAVLVVYRRPIELRAEDEEDLRDLVAEVVVDAVADLLGLDPDEVDPLP